MRPPQQGQVSKGRGAGFPSRIGGRRGPRGRDQPAAEGGFRGAMTIAEKTVMTDAVKAVRQGVQQETPNELVGRQGHDFALVVVPVIAPAETNLLAGHIDQPAVRDGDAVRVAAEIGVTNYRYDASHTAGGYYQGGQRAARAGLSSCRPPAQRA